jgi:hypothetical protein
LIHQRLRQTTVVEIREDHQVSPLECGLHLLEQTIAQPLCNGVFAQMAHS